jgi:putative membrane protein
VSDGHYDDLSKNELAEERTELAEKRSEMAKKRSEMAESRSEMAETRTRLAQERTLNSWVGTGLSSTAVGLAIANLIPMEPTWLPRVIGAIFIGVGVMIYFIAFRSYKNAYDEHEDDPEQTLLLLPYWQLRLLIGALLLSGLLAFLLLFYQTPANGGA